MTPAALDCRSCNPHSEGSEQEDTVSLPGLTVSFIRRDFAVGCSECSPGSCGGASCECAATDPTGVRPPPRCHRRAWPSRIEV